MRSCEVRPLQLVTYENGLQMQERLVAMRQREEIVDQLLLLQHTSVFTLGRGGDRGNLLASPDQLSASRIRFYETNRGGDITYHGPGQLVGYPILHLGEGNRDVRKYVTKLEEVLIRTVREFGVEAQRLENNRGIWVGNEKLAAIGVRIARWVTSHGFALNIDPDMTHYRMITACGLPDRGVTSLRKLTKEPIVVEEVTPVVMRHFADVFDRELQVRRPEMKVAKVVIHDGENVLLLRRTAKAGDFWQPVTGQVEDGELVADAARRELIEETAVDAPVEPLGITQSFMIDPLFTGTATPVFADEEAFVARFAPGTKPVLDSSEHVEARWFTFPEAYEIIRWSDDREAIERVQSSLRLPACSSPDQVEPHS